MPSRSDPTTGHDPSGRTPLATVVVDRLRPVKRAVVRRSREAAIRRMSGDSPQARYTRYRSLSTAEWRKVVFDSVDGMASLPMPGFPPADRQAAYVGNADRDAIREAWKFYRLMAAERERFGLELTRHSQVLDFGCGWGRYARMFLYDVPADNIWCADPLEDALEMCRLTGVPGHRVLLGPLPPSELPAGAFSTAVAYSVFSHLSPLAHDAWRTELARVTAPGGIVFVTTQGRWFLDRCQAMREDPDLVESEWHRKLRSSFIDHEDALRRYDDGEFLFESTSEEGSALAADHYGEAVVPERQFVERWAPDFELLDFVADQARCHQAVAVLRRTGTA